MCIKHLVLLTGQSYNMSLEKVKNDICSMSDLVDLVRRIWTIDHSKRQNNL